MEHLILLFCIMVVASYFIQAIISAVVTSNYINTRKLNDETTMLAGDYLPSIALVAPAYNESKVVIESVRSLLTVQYFNLDIVIVNDGSKDDTLDKLISAFDMTKVEATVYHHIETMPIRGVYKSQIKGYEHLIVIDKENGRKADALNAGINHAIADYYAIIDLDCILEPNALLMMMEPILHEREKKVVAVGGVIGAANDSFVSNGKFLQARTPDSFLSRMQIIEYIRAFTFSRPAWNQFNGMLLISGALGLFEREVLIAVGGCSREAVGEDMDLVMKMHQHCIENKIPYKVDYVPFPLCWTEVPEDPKILASQRNRWMRGTIQCMLKFRKMFLNPRYGFIGMVSYPYWLIAEMLAPVFEFGGIILILVLASMGLVDWSFALMLFALLYLLSLTNSFCALLVYYLNYRKYDCAKDILELFKTAMMEPILYHPRSFYWGLKGYYDYFIKKNRGWGMMSRVGFKRA